MGYQVTRNDRGFEAQITRRGEAGGIPFRGRFRVETAKVEIEFCCTVASRVASEGFANLKGPAAATEAMPWPFHNGRPDLSVAPPLPNKAACRQAG